MNDELYDDIQKKLNEEKPELGDLSGKSRDELIAELLIYQAELEAQNDELTEKQQLLMELNEENQVLYDHAPVAYMVLARDHEILKANIKAQESFFIAAGGRKCYATALCSSDSLNSMLDWCSKERFREPIEALMRTQQGERWFLLQAEMLLADEVMVSLTDIHEMKMLQEKVDEQGKLLLRKAVFESKGEMISMIAHQWRQPLGALSAIMMSQSFDIEMGTMEPELLKQQNADISSIIQHLSDTITTFRKEFDSTLPRQEENLRAIIEKAAKLTESTLLKDEVRLTVACSDPLILPLYENEMLQLFLNLIDNAVYALRQRHHVGRTIEIAVTEDDSEVHIFFRDNGTGIPREMAMRVFEPYYTTKDSLNGTGLGLYLAKTVIEEHHHGRIEVSDNPAWATEFHITLPRSDSGDTQ